MPSGLIALAVAPLVLPKTARGGTAVPDLFGALSLVIGVAALVSAIVEIPSTDSSALKIGAASALALGALALAIWRSGRHHTPAIELDAVRVVPMWSSRIALRCCSPRPSAPCCSAASCCAHRLARGAGACRSEPVCGSHRRGGRLADRGKSTD